MAGKLKRDDPNMIEDVTLIRALRDSNIPKFLAPDIPLFNAILKVHTLHPTPSTLNPKPSTLNPKPLTLNTTH